MKSLWNENGFLAQPRKWRRITSKGQKEASAGGWENSQEEACWRGNRRTELGVHKTVQLGRWVVTEPASALGVGQWV